MRKHGGIWLALLLALLAAAVLAPVAAMASGTGNVAIDEHNFPDAKFQAYVKDNFDTDGNGNLSPAEIASVTTIDVQSKRISDLTGIEHFTALEELDCSYNQLTELDVSKNTALEKLECYSNRLTSLDVSGCTALTYLDCDDNNDLTSLNVSGCTELEELYCSGNQLTSLDVSGCRELKQLICYINQLAELDVSGCTELTYLDCSVNQLTSLNVSGCTKLGDLYCSDNQLKSLDVSKNTALKTLYCSGNQLTTLDVSNNTALEWLYCSGNQLTSLDVSKNTKLMVLDCSNNQLTSLDVSKNAALEWLDCSDNQLTSLDVSQNAALTYLNCSDNQLTTLDVTENKNMAWLICRDQNVLLEVERRPDDTWSADLAERVAGWKEHFENIEANPKEVWDKANNTVTWRDLQVQPTVTYDYDTGYKDNNVPVKMNVTLTLVPLGVGTGADVTGVSVKSIAGVISGTEITVKLPAGSPLPTEKDIAVTLSPYATMTAAPTTTDGGRTWTFTVTSEDEQTVKNYTLYIVYGVTVESGEDGHGTVTASPNPAREGDTVTLTVTPDPGYMLTGWEVVFGDVTVREDNTFVMPGGAVILRPIFAPIPATPPQTGDDSHTGLWLALALVSLGGLCAAAWTARKRRGGAR